LFSGCGGEDKPPQNPAATITAFTVTPETITAGAEVTVAWTVKDATKVDVTAGTLGKVVDGDTRATGSKVVNVNETTTFVLTAFGTGGNAMQMKTVTVMGNMDGPVVDSFTANPL